MKFFTKRRARKKAMSAMNELKAAYPADPKFLTEYPLDMKKLLKAQKKTGIGFDKLGLGTILETMEGKMQ